MFGGHQDLFSKRNGSISLILTTILTLYLSCDAESSINYLQAASGFWEAVSVDPEISSGPAVVVYNWYAISTTEYDDSVQVTWDDGRACTRTMAWIKGNEIYLVVGLVEGLYTIEDEKHATVNFHWDEGTCMKSLEKTKDDPNVYCH
jgi:hypothetical protein